MVVDWIEEAKDDLIGGVIDDLILRVINDWMWEVTADRIGEAINDEIEVESVDRPWKTSARFAMETFDPIWLDFAFWSDVWLRIPRLEEEEEEEKVGHLGKYATDHTLREASLSTMNKARE